MSKNEEIIHELGIAYAMELETVQNYIAASTNLDGGRSVVHVVRDHPEGGVRELDLPGAEESSHAARPKSEDSNSARPRRRGSEE